MSLITSHACSVWFWIAADFYYQFVIQAHSIERRPRAAQFCVNQILARRWTVEIANGRDTIALSINVDIYFAVYQSIAIARIMQFNWLDYIRMNRRKTVATLQSWRCTETVFAKRRATMRCLQCWLVFWLVVYIQLRDASINTITPTRWCWCDAHTALFTTRRLATVMLFGQ